MNIIRNRAYARAGLLGNPSDGYGGKTISVIVRNFWSEVVLYEWDSLEILLAEDDRARFRSIYDLTRDVKMHGYYGGIRLVKATIKRFVDYCQARHISLPDRNFSVRYQTTIPRQTGLAGSSAIIIALLRCLMEYYGVEISLEAQPALALSVEKEELGIASGWQDRVIQVYEGMMYMDFNPARKHTTDGFSSYLYERIPSEVLPPLYLAYHQTMSEPTEVFHDNILERFQSGEEKVVAAMEHLARLAAEGREALLAHEVGRLAELMDENFDTRRSIYSLPAWQVEMVEVARKCGASAKFAGSGGAIVGTYRDESMYQELQARLADIGSRTVKLQVQ
jgi:galactokinase/mevalonate kinase-like predicted kinase